LIGVPTSVEHDTAPATVKDGLEADVPGLRALRRRLALAQVLDIRHGLFSQEGRAGGSGFPKH